MARKKKKHEYFNSIPKYCTMDIDGACIIYELSNAIHGMGNIEVLMNPVTKVRYDGVDAIQEDPHGYGSMFLTIRTGSFLPERCDNGALTWYEHETDSSKELSLEDILVMCSI